eukprot:scaffold107000_cov35-Prasinocladus_malaysianus.AAC.1
MTYLDVGIHCVVALCKVEGLFVALGEQEELDGGLEVAVAEAKVGHHRRALSGAAAPDDRKGLVGVVQLLQVETDHRVQVARNLQIMHRNFEEALVKSAKNHQLIFC